jgi:glycosyltransferase involved in cell wall biosynthesis
MAGPRISVVVNTLNEERNLPFCLRSVRPWADEIVVCDMHSDDRTAAIACELGARVVTHERTGFVEPARAFAVAQAGGDWILVLDADEMVPEPLSRRLRELAAAGQADVVRLPRLNYHLGAPLGHTSWGPHQDLQQRFFRKGALAFSPEIHSHPVPSGRRLDLPYRDREVIVHFNYFDCAHLIEKLNVYTSIEARQARARGRGHSFGRAMWSAGREFLVRYVYRQGFRDGWRGFYLSLFMVFYRLATHAKLKELEAAGDRATIDARYRAEAERWLQGYG